MYKTTPWLSELIKLKEENHMHMQRISMRL